MRQKDGLVWYEFLKSLFLSDIHIILSKRPHIYKLFYIFGSFFKCIIAYWICIIINTIQCIRIECIYRSTIKEFSDPGIFFRQLNRRIRCIMFFVIGYDFFCCSLQIFPCFGLLNAYLFHNVGIFIKHRICFGKARYYIVITILVGHKISILKKRIRPLYIWLHGYASLRLKELIGIFSAVNSKNIGQFLARHRNIKFILNFLLRVCLQRNIIAIFIRKIFPDCRVIITRHVVI